MDDPSNEFDWDSLIQGTDVWFGTTVQADSTEYSNDVYHDLSQSLWDPFQSTDHDAAATMDVMQMYPLQQLPTETPTAHKTALSLDPTSLSLDPTSLDFDYDWSRSLAPDQLAGFTPLLPDLSLDFMSSANLTDRSTVSFDLPFADSVNNVISDVDLWTPGAMPANVDPGLQPFEWLESMDYVAAPEDATRRKLKPGMTTTGFGQADTRGHVLDPAVTFPSEGLKRTFADADRHRVTDWVQVPHLPRVVQSQVRSPVRG